MVGVGVDHDAKGPAPTADTARKQDPADKRDLAAGNTGATGVGLSGLQLLALQRAVGNAAVTRLIAGAPAASRRRSTTADRGVGQVLTSSPVVQRAPPNASVPGPSQSTAPAKPASMNNGIMYQGELILPDPAKCKAVLKKLLPEKGFHGASSYGKSFAEASSDVKATWALFAEPEYQQRCQDAMRSAVNDFDEECRVFMEKFEQTAGNATDAMLINAADQIHKEQTKLGLDAKVSVDRDPACPARSVRPIRQRTRGTSPKPRSPPASLRRSGRSRTCTRARPRQPVSRPRGCGPCCRPAPCP